jgi:hypothetical protein
MQRRNILAAFLATLTGRAFALYDPKPSQLLTLAPGAWSGALTYRDWSKPDKLMTLPCKLSVALSSPTELTLFYVFDDGPSKVVYSYERMSFDFTGNVLSWSSGVSKPSALQYAITSVSADAEGSQLLFERAIEDRTDKYTLILRKGGLFLSKTEVAASGAQTFRNKYEFRRGDDPTPEFRANQK